MQLNLSFLGAAQNVTGSSYLLECGQSRILVDCGLYQERQFRARNWDRFVVDPKTIDAVMLTHAHLDHCGLLPKLVKEGFRGSVYCTAATAEIARITLLDAAHLQEEDARFKQARHQREGRKGPYPEAPLYTVEEAMETFALFRTVDYGQSVAVGGKFQAVFRDAGHILGSGMIEITASDNGESRTVVFSGDVGRPDRPILRDPVSPRNADYVVIESTYGDRVHKDPADLEDLLADIINYSHQAGGNIVIPSFAVERAQEVLYHLNNLLAQDRIPHLMVFLDSPMATAVTGVFENHPELFDAEMTELIRQKRSPFHFSGLKFTASTAESKAINHIKGTVVIIAGSGMCTGGRIKHHLVNNITRPASTVLFVGYQAVGTLGRLILEGKKDVRILGREHHVAARVARINGFSAHADKNELLAWLSGLREAPKEVFVTHGEAEAAEKFAGFLAERTGWKTSVPQYRHTAVLE